MATGGTGRTPIGGIAIVVIIAIVVVGFMIYYFTTGDAVPPQLEGVVPQ